MSTRFLILFPIMLVSLLVVGLAGVLWGTADISWSDRLAVLMRNEDAPRGLSLIIWQWRIPRVLAVGLIGAGLALAGTLMQTALRNPMADPYLMGLSSGASAAAVAAIIWLPVAVTNALGVPFIAFLGSACAFLMTLGLSHRHRIPLDPLIVILAGVAVSLMFQSLTAFFLYIGDPHATRNAMGWLMGTAAGTEWHEVLLLLLPLMVIAGLSMTRVHALDATLLGEERAQAMGVRTSRLRVMIFFATVVLTGLAVSVAGIVGFIGLIVPHMARLLIGARHRVLLPMSMVMGAVVLIGVDLLCRTLLAPQELPLGVLLALFAGPPFVFILRGLRRAI